MDDLKLVEKRELIGVGVTEDGSEIKLPSKFKRTHAFHERTIKLVWNQTADGTLGMLIATIFTVAVGYRLTVLREQVFGNGIENNLAVKRD